MRTDKSEASMKRAQVENLDSFDKGAFTTAFEKLIPQFVTEMSDLLENQLLEVAQNKVTDSPESH